MTIEDFHIGDRVECFWTRGRFGPGTVVEIDRSDNSIAVSHDRTDRRLHTCGGLTGPYRGYWYFIDICRNDIVRIEGEVEDLIPVSEDEYRKLIGGGVPNWNFT